MKTRREHGAELEINTSPQLEGGTYENKEPSNKNSQSFAYALAIVLLHECVLSNQVKSI